MVRHPAAILSQFERMSDFQGKRFILLGENPYLRNTFKRQFSRFVTQIIEETIDPVAVRESALRLRDTLQTAPFPWEKPMVWVEKGDILLSQMSYPEDLPASSHLLVLCSDVPEVYAPGASIPVSFDMKGGVNREFVRWLMTQKGLTGEPDAVTFLTSEFKEDFQTLEKQLDNLILSIHPRTCISMRDLEVDSTGWDTTLLLTAIVKNEEHKVLSEMVQALETFHPKGILTVLTRRVNLLMQVAAANTLSGGQPDSSEIKPWVWRQNAELVKEIPLKRLAQWAITLDKGYAQLSKGCVSYRWTLTNTLLEMCRPV